MSALGSDSPVDPKYEKLYQLLLQEKFPLEMTIKLIGRNTLEFAAGLDRFEGEHPGIGRIKERKSQGDRYLSVTYQLLVSSALHAVALFERAALVPHVEVVL